MAFLVNKFQNRPYKVTQYTQITYPYRAHLYCGLTYIGTPH